MKITQTVTAVGVIGRELDLFEGQYPVPGGMKYNSYIIEDEKIAVLDTADARFTAKWMENLAAVLGAREPDYLIVQHMEPDHSAGIALFAEAYPKATIVASMPAFTMMKNYFGQDFAARRIAVKDGDTLSLGGRELTFVAAPMVHWPEVTMTYDAKEKILFSADAFGTFGAEDDLTSWAEEARRYYIGIVGPFGQQVQNLLKKAADLDIQTICPLHGPVLKEDLGKYLALYNTWSSYEAEEDGVTVAYTSVYGHTKEAVLLLARKLQERGTKVAVYDLARCDTFAAVASAFRYSKLVLATTTYNAGMFPFMQTYLHHLTARKFQKRTVALMENGSWAPMAAKRMEEALAECKDLTFLPGVKITASLDEASLAQLDALVEALT